MNQSTYQQQFLEWASTVRRLRELTIFNYSRTYLYLEKWCGHSRLEEVTAEEIEAFLHRPRRSGQAAPATVKRERDSLRALYRWMLARGIVQGDPTQDVGVPKPRLRDPRPVADEVWVRLWGSDMPREDRVWLGLGYFAGLRRFELATVPPHVFDVDAQMIRGFERKGGSPNSIEYGNLARVVQTAMPWLAERVDEWLADIEWLVNYRRGDTFLSPSTQGKSLIVDCNWFNKRLKTLKRLADVVAPEVSPHALRHSCATNLLRAGVPLPVIADQLSHSNVETTRRYLQTSGQLGRWLRENGGTSIDQTTGVGRNKASRT